MFVRIRLPMGQPHPALLVIDRAIASDQGLKYVYGLDAANKTQYRRITTGALQPDGLRVVEGLHPDDWVTVGGLQQVRPRIQIRPDKVPMPTLGPNPDKGRESARQVGRETTRPAGQEALSARSPSLLVRTRGDHDLAVLHRPADLRCGAVHLHHPDGRDRAALPADRPVPAGHAARGGGVDLLPGGQRPGGVRHGGGADRAAGERRRGHAVHVLADGQ